MRHIVFVVDQGVPVELERDELDADAAHVVALVNGVVVGTARLTWGDAGAHRARVGAAPRTGAGAIAAPARRRPRGRSPATTGEPEVTLHSQTYIQELYAKLGYEVTGPAFLEAGIDHVPIVQAAGVAQRQSPPSGGRGAYAGTPQRRSPWGRRDEGAAHVADAERAALDEGAADAGTQPVAHVNRDERAAQGEVALVLVGDLVVGGPLSVAAIAPSQEPNAGAELPHRGPRAGSSR